jgi:signal transduction histidine kinase
MDWALFMHGESGMQNRMNRNWYSSDLLLSLPVLGLLIFFTYAFFQTPYAGFYFHPSSGEVLEIYVSPDPPDLLQTGDILNQVGDISFESYRRDSTQPLLEGVKPGDTLSISLHRNGEPVTISWPLPGFNPNEFLARLFNIWWLGYAFWAAALFVHLSIRPRDARWRSLIVASYLTALWLVFGTMSSSHMWGSSVLLRVVTWLILPAYLNLHWVFPRPLSRTPKIVWFLLYGIGITLAAGELFRVLPRPLYGVGLILALLGSLILLGAHFAWQPNQRRNVGFLLIAIGISVIPLIGLGVERMLGYVPTNGPQGFIALAIMPIAYFTVIYRQNLGGMKVRTNRIISICIFLVLSGIVLFLLSAPVTQLPIHPEVIPFLAAIVGSIIAVISILLFPRFEAFLEQRFMGINLPYKNLQEIYSTRITTSTSLASLLELLNDEVIPSLLVRQFAFIQIHAGSSKVLLLKGISQDQLNQGDVLEKLAGSIKADIHSALPPDGLTPSWVRLILPLRIGEDLIGLWLLGERDPDDVYAQAEIPILRSLANQTAVALSNIIQTQRLTTMYEANINRYEEEKKRLALDIHDGVLNEMASLLVNSDLSDTSPKFNQAYHQLIDRLREMIVAFRPPMLDYGLKYAIEGIADGLAERNQNATEIVANIQVDGERKYPDLVENHLYRIVQEASENALKYSHAKCIQITGSLIVDRIDIKVEDDGVGFDAESALRLDDMVAKKHFGLAGMFERADLIGAKIKIDSKPGRGTQIQVSWGLK